MRLSDMIEEFIKELWGKDETQVELKRNELAEYFRCAPSQINYVLSTRFSPERGYVVESRRGGGGYIRITRVRTTPRQLMMHTVNAVGDALDRSTAEALLSNAVGAGALSPAAARLIAAAVSDQALRTVPPAHRDAVRSSFFKYMIVTAISTDY